MALDKIYNRFDEDKNWKSMGFVPGRRLQTAELNELQSMNEFFLKSWADNFFGKFAIISGCSCNYVWNEDVNSFIGKISEGVIYHDGAFFKLPEYNKVIRPEAKTDSSRSSVCYLKFSYEEIDSSKDLTLVDPAVGYNNYGQSGANRKVLKYDIIIEDSSEIGVSKDNYDENKFVYFEYTKVGNIDNDGEPFNMIAVRSKALAIRKMSMDRRLANVVTDGGKSTMLLSSQVIGDILDADYGDILDIKDGEYHLKNKDFSGSDNFLLSEHSCNFDKSDNVNNSFVAGNNNEVHGDYSSLFSYNGIANGLQLVGGQFNSSCKGGKTHDTATGSTFILGKGISDTIRSNAFRVSSSGNVYGSYAYESGGSDYAEKFEWLDGNPNNEDRRGLFVTLENGKIRLYDKGDDYILGVVSSNSSVVGGSYDDYWHGMYERDIFGETIKEDIIIPEYIDKITGKVVPEHIATVEKISPTYNPYEEYVPRSKRKEWASIGLFGKMIVVDDGSCVVDSYCMPGDNGVAEDSTYGFRVISRLDDNHICILFSNWY